VKAGEARLFVGAVTLIACVGPLTAQPDRVRERDPDWTAPLKDAARPNPLANQTGMVAGGQKLYRQRCNTCHGENGRGTSRAPSLEADDVQAQTDGALFWKITSGNTHAGMPSFSFLPEAQRWQLVLHLRILPGAENQIEVVSPSRRTTGGHPAS
jgi:mono/diheme cytochrome c family protein